MQKVLHLFFDLKAHVFTVCCTRDEEQPSVFELEIEEPYVAVAYLKWWILVQLREVFLHALPAGSIDCRTSDAVCAQPQIKGVVDQCVAVITQTSEFICSLALPPGCACQHEKTLFYNADDNTLFRTVHDGVKKANPVFVLYENFATGWNKLKRRHENPAFMDAPAMLAFIMANRIRTLVTINMYYLEFLLNRKGIHLPAVFSFLGVECICFDIDWYELVGAHGNLIKQALNNPRHRRFSNQQYVHEPVDRLLANHNIRYFTISSLPERLQLNTLSEDYDIVVASHSRVKNVLGSLAQVLFVLDRLGSPAGYNGFVAWMFGTIDFLLHDQSDSWPKRQFMLGQLMFLSEAIMAFFKLDLVGSLNTNRAIKVFGDDGWQALFPEWYQRVYLKPEELAALSAEGRSLFLLPNHITSYLETQPALDVTLGLRNPYLIYPAFVTTPELEGMRTLECGQANDLNAKVADINTLVKSQGLRDALGVYGQVARVGFDLLVNWIAGQPEESVQGQGDVDASGFRRLQQTHYRLFFDRVSDYRTENDAVIREVLGVFFGGRATEFRVDASWVFEKPIVQKLLFLAKQQDR